MNSYRAWLKSTLIATISICTLVFCINYYLDVHHIRNQYPPSFVNSSADIRILNEGYPLLIKQTALRKGGYTTLILGTSRSGVLNPDRLTAYLGGKSYNGELPSARIDDMQKMLEFALRYNNIQNVLLGVELIEFKSKSNIYEDSLFKYYSSLSPIGDLLFGRSMNPALNAIYLSNGMRYYHGYEQQLRAGKYDHQAAIKSHITTYVRPGGLYADFKFSEDMFKQYLSLLDLCKRKGISVRIVILPIYIDQLNALYTIGLGGDYERLLIRLSSVSDFYDFNGINYVTANIQNYYDSSHTRTGIVDQLVFKAVFTEAPSSLTWGAYITKDNVKEHISKIRGQIRPIELETYKP